MKGGAKRHVKLLSPGQMMAAPRRALAPAGGRNGRRQVVPMGQKRGSARNDKKGRGRAVRLWAPVPCVAPEDASVPVCRSPSRAIQSGNEVQRRRWTRYPASRVFGASDVPFSPTGFRPRASAPGSGDLLRFNREPLPPRPFRRLTSVFSGWRVSLQLTRVAASCWLSASMIWEALL